LKKYRSNWLGIIGILIVVVIISGCTNSPNSSNKTPNTLIGEYNFTGGTMGVQTWKIIPLPANTTKVRIEYFGLDDGPNHHLGIIDFFTIPTVPTLENVQEAVDPKVQVDSNGLNLMSNHDLAKNGNITLNASDKDGFAKSLVVSSTDTKWSFKVFSTT
jgi:hypothetical protein